MGRRGLFEDAAQPVEGQGEESQSRAVLKTNAFSTMNAPRQGALGSDFAGVAYDEALRRARELVPSLRERAAGAENARVMPPETLRDLHATGLIRTLQP